MRMILILILFSFMTLSPGKKQIDPVHFISNYKEYRYPYLSDRQFNQARHSSILRELTDKNPDAKLHRAGTSFEDREIFAVKWGRGKKKILLWTQMHGDEPTATLAFIDFLNFLIKEQDSQYIKELADSITLWGIPCLNPDGAVRYTRRNAQDIDINRDAIELKTPEARILDSIARVFQPIWAFNLHDQSAYYTTERSPGEIHFSFQAPPINKENGSSKEIIEVEKLFSLVISQMEPVLDHSAIARYPIKYSENAFGERFQQQGIKTLLIESGYKNDDPEKQYLRRIHAAMLIQLLENIAFDKYRDASPDIYNNLPECQLNYHDLVIEHIKIPYKNSIRNMDVGFRKVFRACQLEGRLTPVSYLGSLGKPYELKGERYINGKFSQFETISIYPDTLQSVDNIADLELRPLIEKGYFALMLREAPDSCLLSPDFPFIVNKTPPAKVMIGHPLSFVLRGETAVNSYLIHNGYVHNLEEIDSAYISNRIKYSTNEKNE